MAKKEKDLYWWKSEESTSKIFMFKKKRHEAKKQSLANLDPKKKADQNKVLKLKKYDPVLRKHVLFTLAKAKK